MTYVYIYIIRLYTYIKCSFFCENYIIKSTNCNYSTSEIHMICTHWVVYTTNTTINSYNHQATRFIHFMQCSTWKNGLLLL